MTFRLAAATALILAFATGTANAATLMPVKPCYASSGPATGLLEDIDFQGTGFEPSTTVEVLIDGVPVGAPPTDSIGRFQILVDAPYQPAGERPFTITARDAVNNLSLTSRVTDLAVTVKPRRAAPDRKVRFRGRGFMRDAPVYAHYVFGGRDQKTVRMARRTTGACGTFSVKRRQIPIESPRAGRWRVQFDQRRVYAPDPNPVWVRIPIDVVEVFLEP